ncbi:choline transporter-like protein 1 [Euwallacea fornicatus]|uniref:choline transporter-like protein 1 n=1 Tax=Euwallacea fornicatus TaxID=995702 RepID=UPI00338E1F87
MLRLQEWFEEYQKTKPGSELDFQSVPVKNRKTTDVFFLTVFAIFLSLVCFLVVYCVYHGNIGRIIYGYDNCGTVCGDKRKVDKLENCYKTTDEKNFGSYHLVYYKPEQPKLFDRICTNNCSHYEGYKVFLNRCIPTNKKTVLDKFFTKTGLGDFFVEMTEDFDLYWKVLIYMCLISLGMSLVLLFLFPFLAGFLVWVILLGVVLACIGASIYLWMSWKELKDLQKLDSEIQKREVYTYLGLAITATCVSVIVLLVILVLVKRIKLVIQLFKEAGKAISAMPFILLVPLLTFLSIIATLAIWIYFCLWISSAGHLSPKRENIYYFKKDGFMETAKVVNFFAMLWMIQFVIGCQHMVIAGAVAKWYFTREKSKLSSPVIESFYNLTRYHLGTVATGSFWLALVQMLRAFLALVQNKLKDNKESQTAKILVWVCHCCLWVLQKVLSIISRNAYIITAMYGYPFYKAGKQAFEHLVSNPLRVAAINSVGDFVLFLSKVLVVACSVAIAAYFLKHKEGVQHAWVPLLLIGLFSYFISHCFMTVYEMTIDTIFLCFCEDCRVNDGNSKPYYMSRGLMEFVENSNIALERLDKNTTNNAVPFDEMPLPTLSRTLDKEK